MTSSVVRCTPTGLTARTAATAAARSLAAGGVSRPGSNWSTPSGIPARVAADHHVPHAPVRMQSSVTRCWSRPCPSLRPARSCRNQDHRSGRPRRRPGPRVERQSAELLAALGLPVRAVRLAGRRLELGEHVGDRVGPLARGRQGGRQPTQAAGQAIGPAPAEVRVEHRHGGGPVGRLVQARRTGRDRRQREVGDRDPAGAVDEHVRWRVRAVPDARGVAGAEPEQPSRLRTVSACSGFIAPAAANTLSDAPFTYSRTTATPSSVSTCS